MSPKEYIEKRTGMLYGTYRWRAPAARGPAPLFSIIIRPPNTEWVRFEISLCRRTFYLTWGHQA